MWARTGNTDEIMGVSQLLEARARAVPKYTSMAVQHYVDFTDSCFRVYPADISYF